MPALTPGSSLASVSRSDGGALIDLLVGSVAAYGRERDAGELARLVARAPVEYLPAVAALHRVSGVVLDSLADVANVPDPVMEALTERRRRASISHLGVARALRTVADRFERADVAWVAMKGPVLASTMYLDVGDREYGDLDLLIRPSDLPTAVALLEAAGYEHDIKNWPLAESLMVSEFNMTSGPIDIDVHWHFVYAAPDRQRFGLDPAEMVGRRRPVDVAGFAVPTFDSVDTLLHLAFHAARSGAHRIVWLKDIERCLTLTKPDLAELVRRTRQYGCGSTVAVALDRARLVGAQVPDEVLVSLAGRRLLAVDRGIRRVSPPLRLHEDSTIARLSARSLHRSVGVTMRAALPRLWRAAKRRVITPPVHETGDDAERAHFLSLIARS